ncbi:hypothetical protein [Ornithinicoccus hortensis]|uniref:Big-1 domain-containing protein n=1 Tax=Ornithinicoccus hortensis TaxID=82346 RepID=A0A542YUW4_9MICO|nr:hypothetical protein [Ornithinicoccus hortensis]TQL51863.1 hypothetical protein FB467_3030 [Ornithinicoccus hortensis]
MSGRQLRAGLAGLLVLLLLAFAGAGTVLASEQLTDSPVAAPGEETPGGEDPGSGDGDPPVIVPPGEVVLPEPPPEFAPPETEPPAEVAPPEVEPPVEVVLPEPPPEGTPPDAPVEGTPPEAEPPAEVGPPDAELPPDSEPPAEIVPPEVEPPSGIAPAQVPEIVIDPVDSSGPTGTVVTWMAMVTVDGEPAMDAEIEFRGTMDGQPDIVETGVVGSTGEAMHSHTREVAGTETLQVTVTAGEETGTATTTFVWQEPPPEPVVELDLVPLDSNGPVGVDVTWSATVTVDGEPVDGAAVYFYATMDDDTVPQEEFTDGNGVATFVHTREVPGVDNILVETFAFEDVSVETTFTWRQPLGVTLSPEFGSGEHGTDQTWSVSVMSGEEGEVAGAEVVFLGQLDGEPDVSETFTTGPSGVVEHTHTRDVVGTESLLITVTYGEETVSVTGSFDWVPVVELDLVPLDSNGPIEVPVTWTATLTADGEPLAEQWVNFHAWRQGDDGGEGQEAMTDEDGVATFVHTRSDPGVDDIVVDTFVFEEEFVETTFTWREPLGVTLSPEFGSGEHGTDQTWSVSVESGDDPVAGAEVVFLGQLEGEPDVTETFTTSSSGVVEHTHTRDVTGTESLLVTVTYGEETVSVTGSFDWEPVVELDLVPLDSNGPVGVEVIWTATVTADGEPVVGQWVEFSATGEGLEAIWYLGETSADGTVQFGHSRSEPAVDDIEVRLFEEDTAVTTTFTWREPLEVTLSAGGGSAEVGTLVEWTVSITSGGEGVEGVSVGFLGQLAGEPDVEETVTTDSSGLATHTHTREAAGTELMTVAATYGEETVTVTDSFVWEEPPPLLEIQLEPEDASGWTGDPVTWTATVTADGEPLGETWVTFSASMEGAETVYLEDLTDDDGTARFEHTRTQPGEDTIWVGVEGLGQEVWAETTFVWEEPVPVVTLTQSSGNGQVGTPLTWTATVTSGDDGMAGVPVRFLGQLAGQPDVDVTISTDASGIATHTHTRSVAGTESLLVAADVDGEVVSATGSFVWESPPAVHLDLTPEDAAGPVGEAVEWVATVSADGTPQPGQSLIFTASTAGADDVTVEGVTGADGTAVFAHTRAAAGVDSITVQGVVLGQEVSATTTFTWQAPPPVLQVEVTPASSSGVIGSATTWTATVTLDGAPVEGASVEFLGVLPGTTDILDPAVLTDDSGEAAHGHTRTVAGTETVTATATLDDLTATASAQRTWTTAAEPPAPPVPPVIPPPGPPVTPPPVTPPPVTPPSGPPPVGPPATTPPASPPATTPPAVVPPVTVALPVPAQPPAADPPSVGDIVDIIEDPGTDDGDTVAAPPEVPTAPTTPTTTTPPSVPLTNVALGSHSATPGGDLEVSGSGCAPGSTVQILLGGEPLATATADANGDFTARAAVSSMPLGQYAVDVECEGRTGAAQVDLVSTVASSTAPAAAASAAAVLTFFVLLGAGVIKGSVGSAG